MCVFACVCVCVRKSYTKSPGFSSPLPTSVPSVTSQALAPSGGSCHSLKDGSAKTHQPSPYPWAKIPYGDSPLGYENGAPF